MKKEKQDPNRDSKGRFSPPGYMDAEQKKFQVMKEDDERKAKVLIELCEICKRHEIPLDLKELGVHQHPESGYWSIGNHAHHILYGILCGFILAKRMKESEIASFMKLSVEGRS